MLVYFHYITCSTSLNCFLPLQIRQEILQCSFCELFFDSIHNKWYKRAALFYVCIWDKWEPDHSSTKIRKGWFIPTNTIQISSVALVATGSIIIWYCNRFSLVVKKSIACGQTSFLSQKYVGRITYGYTYNYMYKGALQWRHGGHTWQGAHYNDVMMGIMASQITSLTIVCLLNRLFRRDKKTSKLRVTGPCVGNSPVTGEFPVQMASNAENVSIWWRHHG